MARFGKFEVISMLGKGGMAEVYRCRLTGIGGFDKAVVVKRILPERASDPVFVRMFLDEARLAANLNHPNIAQVFEIDEIEGTPYIAMEYVKGPTLAMLVRESRRQNKIHLGHFAKIVAGICSGLHYAHSAVDSEGEAMRLVHRDVSPQNIIVSMEGVPKLLDFGVAKADGRLVHTQAGTLKGKLRYMAPEQVTQEQIDHRVDVFGAGVCLYEAATGQNPYGPPNTSEISLIKKIANGDFVRPSQIATDIPVELENIILWAIEPNVERRCPSAHHLHEALEGFVASGRFSSRPQTLVRWIAELFPNLEHTGPIVDMMSATPRSISQTPRSSSVRLPASASIAGAIPIGPIPGGSSGSIQGGSVPGSSLPSGSFPSGSLHSGPIPTGSIRTGSIHSGPIGYASTPQPEELDSKYIIQVDRGALQKRKRLWYAVSASLVLVLGVGGFVAYKYRPRSGGQGSVSNVSAPEAARPAEDLAVKAFLDEAERFAGHKRFGPALDMLNKARERKIDDPALHIRLARLSDSIETEALIRRASRLLDSGEARQAIDTAKMALDRDPENTEAVQIIGAARKLIEPEAANRVVAVGDRLGRAGKAKDVQLGRLTVSSNPPGMVYLDDEPLGRAPIRERPVAAGKHIVQVRAHGYKPAEMEIKILAGRPLTVSVPMTVEVEKRPAVVIADDPVPAAKPKAASPSTVVATSSPAAHKTPSETPAPAGTGSGGNPSVSSHGSSAAAPKPAPAPMATPIPVAKPAVPTSAPEASAQATPKPAAPVQTPAPAPVASSKAIYSARPKSPIPVPHLPRMLDVKDGKDIARALAMVEQEAMSAGVTPEYAKNITGSLRNTLVSKGESKVYPGAIYYQIIREAALGHSNSAAASNLVSMYLNGQVLRFKDLPVR